MDEEAQVRAAETDRERVVEQLRTAHGEGRLTLAEFDERVATAWAARTYGELVPVTADLPRRPTGVEPAEPAARRAARHPGWSSGRPGSPVRAWAAASAINLVIWAVVSIATLSLVYPWWIWVAGPWGVMLLVRRVSERRSVALGAS
jgi:Flp pilus assembly protein TadB